MTRSLQIDMFAPAAAPEAPAGYTIEQLQAALHFASGVNTLGEVHGLANNGMNIGVAHGETPPDVLLALAMYGQWVNARLMLDTGAFSEVRFDPAGGPPVVVRPIRDAAWAARFELQHWAARTYPPLGGLRRCLVVAPDRVGDQAVTLERMARFSAEVRAVAELGAVVIVPVHRGELPMPAMFAACRDVLQLPPDQVAAGVPVPALRRDPRFFELVAELAGSLPAGACVHLLGLGPESPRFAPAVAAIRRACAGARITSDSGTLRRLVGRTNGPGGGPRVLTRYQDEERATGAPSHGVKDVAISRWRQDLHSIEEGFERRRIAGEIGLG